MRDLRNDWDALLALPPPWAHLICAREGDVERALRTDASANVGIVVRILRGQRCGTKRGLFQEWAAALQFPYYFGENWDAFEECVNDLGWLPGRGYILAITDADRILREEEGFGTFIEILASAAARWAGAGDISPRQVGRAVPFHVVFHCVPDREAATRHRFAEVGIELNMLRLPRPNTPH